MSLAEGDCAEFDTAIHVKTFYYRGESEWYRDGRHRTREFWGKGQKFAIWDNTNFQYYNAQEKVLNSTLVEFAQGRSGKCRRFGDGDLYRQRLDHKDAEVARRSVAQGLTVPLLTSTRFISDP